MRWDLEGSPVSKIFRKSRNESIARHLSMMRRECGNSTMTFISWKTIRLGLYGKGANAISSIDLY